MRYRIAAAWALCVVIPAVAVHHLPERPGERASWLLACAVSLVAWLSLVEGLAHVRQRRPGAAWALALVVALFAPLWIEGSNSYFAAMHGDLPPSAVWFCYRNPRYAYVLACEATSPLVRAALVASPIVLLLLLEAATRRPLSPAPPPLRRLRLVVPAVALVLLGLPGAARTVDLEGLRATVGGTAMYLMHARPHLGTPTRVQPSSQPPALDRPNVLLVVQESLAARQWAPWNRTPSSSPRIDALLRDDEDVAVWFDDAITAAGATAVSLPTILTGLSPDAPGDDFTRAPLLWQEARALGYRTALLTAQSYEWLGFRQFFLGADAPDVARTAAELAAPRVNDNGVADGEVAAAATRFIDATPLDRPFLVVVQLNATHRPCWAPSIDDGLPMSERCLLAARYVDEVTAGLVDHLRARGRLDDTLVLGTSDHGESFRDDRPPRLESYYEDVTRVPLWMRLPRAWLARHPDARAHLASAAAARVSNLDLFATLLDVWGRWPLPPGERPRLAGSSLLRPLDPDRALVVASTGDIHDFRWSNEGFALYHGRWKWLCDARGGCRLFDIDADPNEEHDLRAVAPAAELARFHAEIRTRPNLRRILTEMRFPSP